MKRRVFNLLTAVSLLLCAGAVALWSMADKHPYCRVTIRWVEQPTKFQSHLSAIGWDELGLFWRTTDETCLWPGYYARDIKTGNLLPGTAHPFRKFFYAIGPANQTITKWSASETPYIAYENLNPAFFGLGGSIITRGGYDLPFPLLILALFVLPAIWSHGWLYRWRRDRAAARIGLCPHCGYNLRATPDRCPECGTVPPRKDKGSSTN